MNLFGASFRIDTGMLTTSGKWIRPVTPQGRDALPGFLEGLASFRKERSP